MKAISRFFNLMITIFFILWMVLHLFEMDELSTFCLVAVLILAACMLIVRLFIFFKIYQHRLKQ